MTIRISKQEAESVIYLLTILIKSMDTVMAMPVCDQEAVSDFIHGTHNTITPEMQEYYLLVKEGAMQAVNALQERLDSTQ